MWDRPVGNFKDSWKVNPSKTVPAAPRIVARHENRESPSGKALQPWSPFMVSSNSSDCNRLVACACESPVVVRLTVLFLRVPGLPRLACVLMLPDTEADCQAGRQEQAWRMPGEPGRAQHTREQRL